MDKYQHIACKLPKTTKRSQCAICLHIHHIKSLPSPMNGKFIIVECKKTKRSKKGEKTLPIEVCEGNASFDVVFLHYCSVREAPSVLKGIVLLVLVVDKVDCCLGRFKIGSENLNCEIIGGKLVSFDLDGIGNGGVLSVGVFWRLLEEEEEEGDNSCSKIDKKQNKTKCFSCFPDFRKLKKQPQIVCQPKRITFENSIRKQCRHPQDEEDESFITIEKDIVPSLPRHPPSGDLEFVGDHGSIEQFDAGKVEDEFLKMLDRKGKGVKGSLKCFSFDLDSLIKEAEMEQHKGELLEKEEYVELMKSWGSNYETTSSQSGFGSPF